MSSPCPCCSEPGSHFEEDQFRCENPECRVSLFEGYGQTGGFR